MDMITIITLHGPREVPYLLRRGAFAFHAFKHYLYPGGAYYAVTHIGTGRRIYGDYARGKVLALYEHLVAVSPLALHATSFGQCPDPEQEEELQETTRLWLESYE